MGGYRLRRPRLRIGAKFSAVLALLAVCLITTGLVSEIAQERMKAGAQRQYSEHIVNLHRIAVLNATLAATGLAAVELVNAADTTRQAQLRTRLDNQLVPEMERQVAALREDTETTEERTFALELSATWQSIETILTSSAFLAAADRKPGEQADERLTARVTAAFESASGPMAVMNAAMAEQARTTHVEIDNEYRRTRDQLAVIVVGALVAGVGSVILLVRDVVPRIRTYSRFAAEVAAGRLSARLRPTGSDELSDLGHSLNHMVERRAADHDFDTSQASFSAALQLAESETEAYTLLKRHLESCVPGATAVVLNRNNSANRLQPATAVPEGSDLAGRLSTATPRDCLAIRFARPHAAAARREALLPCLICGDAGTAARCEPLIVGGEVIGSVLVQRNNLSPEQERYLRESVTYAAPVLANQRNLALAEHRALTDALTGLPNQRASHDTILQAAAHAGRTLNPLAAVLLDLDHFKQTNDLYGHDKGDEVLASVGATLATALRAGDFAGRFGGEEFLLLLPDTGSGEAAGVAERLRAVLSALTIPGIDRQITASFGIAVLPDHAADAATLLRRADAALYAAKAAGRDRVHVAADTADNPRPDPQLQVNG